MLDGYEITSYPAVRPGVEAVGCSWVDEATVDRNFVTAQAWPDHDEWLAEFLPRLGTQITHQDVAAAAD